MISKLQLIKSSIISKNDNEKGIVLIGAIALIAILALLGTVGIVTTSTEILISRNYKTSVQASYAAQAGIEEAKARLRGSSSDPNYAGDPAANPDPTWSAYILTSSSWQTSDDPDYVGTYTNYIPTTSDHTNTTLGTNTIQTAPDISYWVKIRHKREADLFPAEQYTDNGSGTNDIIYYGYEAPTSTTLKQFTTDANPYTASPVEIITSYGSSGTSSGIIEVQASRLNSPPIVAAVYGETVEGAGNITIIGNDACTSNPIPAVAYVYGYDFNGAAHVIESDAGAYAQIDELEVLAIVNQLETTATITLTQDQNNFSAGSISNYEVVFCDATQLPDDQELDINNLSGYGTLAVRGDADFGGNINWNGLIIVSGNTRFHGGGTKEIYGAVMSQNVENLNGTVEVYYSSCDIDNANNSYRYTTLRWKDKTLN
jgi:Tfp pilus assembly protein PilX